MAIYTGGMRQQAEARAEANRLAEKQAKAQKKERKRKKWSGILGSIGGALAGAATVGLMGLTGGLAAPLVMGAATSLSKKWVDEGTKKGRLGKGLKGADPSKIKSESEYGYGHSQAASLREGLEESRKTDWSAQTMLGDIGSAYLTAGLAGDLGAGKEALKAGKYGAAFKTGKGGFEGVKQSLASLIPGGAEGGGDYVFDEASQAIVPEGSSSLLAADEYLDTSAMVSEVDEWENPISMEREGGLIYQQGGQVLSQEELMGLRVLEDWANPTAYTGTALSDIKMPSASNVAQGIRNAQQGEGGQPTISEYFESEGKTLGGSNTKSLSQRLGT